MKIKAIISKKIILSCFIYKGNETKIKIKSKSDVLNPICFLFLITFKSVMPTALLFRNIDGVVIKIIG